MSFLRRLKARRGKAPAPLRPPGPGGEDRAGPLAHCAGGEQAQGGEQDLGQALGVWSRRTQRSRLSKTIREVLHDHSALGYLVQYLEARDAAQLVRFWLDVESFRSSASAVITSSYVPPCLDRQRLDEVAELPEADDCYAEAESACPETASLPNASTSTDSFDSGLDTRSESLEPSTSPPAGRAEQLLQTQAEDAVKIYRRYIAPECQRPVHLTTDTKRAIVETICCEGGQVAADCFDSAQELVVASLETEYFPDFLTSPFHAKHQVDLLTSGEVHLTDILYNDTALFHFMEFLEARGQRVVMEFWLAATNFSMSGREGGGPEERQADAMVLYDKFLSMQATSPLGLPSSVRLQVEDAICRPEGPDSACFLLPLQLVARHLESGHLQPFLLSPLYTNYVKELIATIQAAPRVLPVAAQTSPSCRTESDTRSSCSSDLSADSRPSPRRRHTANTLLAVQSSNRPDLGLEELQDPDSLWRRPPVRDKVGRVNSFGRYQPGLDLAPDMNRAEGTKKTSRLGRVVKNLVTNDEKERMKEELAWQVAEDIVRDITSVTMPGRGRRTSAGEEEPGRAETIRKSKSESFSLKELSLEMPTAKYF